MSSAPTIHNFSHDALRCRFWLRIAEEDPAYARNAAEGVFRYLDDLDFQTDARHDSGPVAALNALPVGTGTTIGEHVRALWEFAHGLREETGGAFDAGAGRLFRYWESRAGESFNPDDQEWTEVMSAARAGGFRLEGEQLFREQAGAVLDFGSVLRGYALDRMAEMLEGSWGIHRALLMASGNVTLALDPPGDSVGWRIGVGPRLEVKLCRFALASKSSAGLLANLVDPRSGHPVTLAEPLRALCTSALEAEGVAMAACVLSPAECEDFVNRGCSRGVWLTDGSRLGSLACLDIEERPGGPVS